VEIELHPSGQFLIHRSAIPFDLDDLAVHEQAAACVIFHFRTLEQMVPLGRC
jgi:hypothetical protein